MEKQKGEEWGRSEKRAATNTLKMVAFEASTDEKMEKKNLLEAIKESFSDVLSSEDGSSEMFQEF